MLFDYKLKYYDYRLILYMLLLSALGVVMIISASNHNSATVTKQVIGVLAGFFLAAVLSLVDYHKLLSLYAVIYLVCIISLVAVLVLGHTAGGATRWINVPGIGRIQPSEFVKIGLILFFSWYCSKYQEKISRLWAVAAAALLFAIPAYLIYAEPNLSTTLVTAVIVISIIFAAGISYKWILGVLAVMLPSGGLFLFLLLKNKIPFILPYQANRILVWLNPQRDMDAYRQQKNSIMAISSGQLQGKGLFNTTIISVKDGNFLSQEKTDFIFAVIGEEMGFIGSMVLVCLFILLVYECLYLASKARDLPGRLICVGMAAWVGFQAFANIAVATGIFPNTGLPLPFISSGVSSLLSIFIGMGVVLNVGLQRRIGNY